MKYFYFKTSTLVLAMLLIGVVNAEAESTYESKHGFKIDYPDGWHLETFMEIYENFRQAERVGGNFFRITSYPEDDARSQSRHLFSRDELRVDVWVYHGYNGTLGQLVTETEGITKLENFTIDGKKAKKVWRKAEDESTLEDDQIFSIYFVDEGKKVIFVCSPSYSSQIRKCDEIAGSFRFE